MNAARSRSTSASRSACNRALTSPVSAPDEPTTDDDTRNSDPNQFAMPYPSPLRSRSSARPCLPCSSPPRPLAIAFLLFFSALPFNFSSCCCVLARASLSLCLRSLSCKTATGQQGLASCMCLRAAATVSRHGTHLENACQHIQELMQTYAYLFKTLPLGCSLLLLQTRIKQRSAETNYSIQLTSSYHARLHSQKAVWLKHATALPKACSPTPLDRSRSQTCP